MKKDILAVITFVATGVLFYLIQVGAPAAPSITSLEESGSAVEILMDSSDIDSTTGLLMEEGGIRDS